MQKILITLLVSLSLFGCSSIELESLSSSSEETQRILALGLTHEENLIEAKKLDGNHLISVVTLQLNDARDEKIQAEIDQVESERFADLMKISQDGMKFIGSEISESLATILSTELDIQKYNLEGTKDLSSGSASHKLSLTFEYKSSKSRNYKTANFCDKWTRCDGEMMEIISVSVDASECTANSCIYTEVVQLELDDLFLRNSSDTGFTMRFYSDKKSNKINISKAYLTGYLKVLN